MGGGGPFNRKIKFSVENNHFFLLGFSIPILVLQLPIIPLPLSTPLPRILKFCSLCSISAAHLKSLFFFFFFLNIILSVVLGLFYHIFFLPLRHVRISFARIRTCSIIFHILTWMVLSNLLVSFTSLNMLTSVLRTFLLPRIVLVQYHISKHPRTSYSRSLNIKTSQPYSATYSFIGRFFHSSARVIET